jgi:hypothetical protein
MAAKLLEACWMEEYDTMATVANLTCNLLQQDITYL